MSLTCKFLLISSVYNKLNFCCCCCCSNLEELFGLISSFLEIDFNDEKISSFDFAKNQNLFRQKRTEIDRDK